MTVTRPVHHALVPEISRTPDELTAGNTASSGAKALADFLGPALAGLALFVVDAGWIFVVIGLAGLVSAGLVWRITVVQRAVDGTDMGSYVADAVQGVHTVMTASGGVFTPVRERRPPRQVPAPAQAVALVLQVREGDGMTRTVSQRELRNDSGAIMRVLDRGEVFVVTRNGIPAGELRPARRQSIRRELLVEAFARTSDRCRPVP